jgi:phosphoglycolate phosphatase-like HAD superfamily hydrolase
VIVLDLDGTLIDPTEASLNQRDHILSIVKQGVDAETIVSEAEVHTLSDPFGYPMLFQGTVTAFAEDSYLWRYAQLRRMWNSLSSDKTPEELSSWMFNSLAPKEHVPADGAREFIQSALNKGYEPVIITNSSTEKAQKVCESLRLCLEAYGNAKKFHVVKGHSFKIGGRDCFSERPEYEKALKEVMKKYKVEPQEMTVVGDVFSLDLALPLRLGMRCIMKKNNLSDGFRTPSVFIEGARKLGVPVAKDLSEIAEML